MHVELQRVLGLGPSWLVLHVKLDAAAQQTIHGVLMHKLLLEFAHQCLGQCIKPSVVVKRVISHKDCLDHILQSVKKLFAEKSLQIPTKIL